MIRGAVDPAQLRQLLDDVAAGRASAEAATRALTAAIGAGVTDATLDLARADRTGVPEVVLGEWKTAEEIAAIVAGLAAGVPDERLRREFSAAAAAALA